MVVNEWNILDEEIILGRSLAGFKRKLDRHLRDKRGYISFNFLPLNRQLDDLDSLTHQVQVQVQVQGRCGQYRRCMLHTLAGAPVRALYGPYFQRTLQ